MCLAATIMRLMWLAFCYCNIEKNLSPKIIIKSWEVNLNSNGWKSNHQSKSSLRWWKRKNRYTLALFVSSNHMKFESRQIIVRWSNTKIIVKLAWNVKLVWNNIIVTQLQWLNFRGETWYHVCCSKPKSIRAISVGSRTEYLNLRWMRLCALL